MSKYIVIFLLLTVHIILKGQPAPASDENIPFLVTFGGNSVTSWGDDDFCQIFFCLVPADYTKPVYIRIFDPEIGGKYDENKGAFDTFVSFSVYGGQGCWSDKDAKATEPTGNYKRAIKCH